MPHELHTAENERISFFTCAKVKIALQRGMLVHDSHCTGQRLKCSWGMEFSNVLGVRKGLARILLCSSKYKLIVKLLLQGYSF